MTMSKKSRGVALEPADTDLLKKQFQADRGLRIVQNAVTRVTVDDVAIDRSLVNEADHTMSSSLDDWKVTSQGKSGRCWLFAGLNLLRPGAMAKLNVKEFEFSQNFMMFWDKLERANYFLEAVIETAGRDVDDRTVAYLLDSVAGDGGQWNMFVALVDKYGLVPKAFMPETQSSSETARMNSLLRRALRKGALELRGRVGDLEAIQDQRADILQVVYRILSIHLGSPPDRFFWQWQDKDKAFHREGYLTPREFADTYVTLPIQDYVCLVHDPRPANPTNRTYTVEYLGNVLGAPPVTYLNVDVAVMKELAARTIEGGEPVWFGCDVGKMMSNDYALWDAKLFDYDSVYGTSLDLSKVDRLIAHDSQMTHAMLFTGVDRVDGSPRRWRVENSWGPERGREGFFTMNDSWFDEYLFEVAVRRELLSAELQEALKAEPAVLPAWDPMGALAH
ncbi:MAG: C1 family peptidase [Acidimicrobiales bacterium]